MDGCYLLWFRRSVRTCFCALGACWCIILPAQAGSILSGSFDVNLPFGPFSPGEAVAIEATLTNTSTNTPINICEGVCVGGPNTFSIGGLAFIPTATGDQYSFFFGDGAGTASDPWQLDGETLAPGEVDTFVFAEYTPTNGPLPVYAVPGGNGSGEAALGTYSFSTQMQIFAATQDRPMLEADNFSGTWQVVPEPSSALLFACSILLLGWISHRTSRGGPAS